MCWKLQIRKWHWHQHLYYTWCIFEPIHCCARQQPTRLSSLVPIIMILVLGFSFRVPSFTSSSAGLPGRTKRYEVWIISSFASVWWNIIFNCSFHYSIWRPPCPPTQLTFELESEQLLSLWQHPGQGLNRLFKVHDCVLLRQRADGILLASPLNDHWHWHGTHGLFTQTLRDVAAVWNALEEEVFPATKKRSFT